MRILSLAFIIGMLLPLNVLAGIQSAAFLYGPNPPLAKTKAYDVVVVHPDSTADPSKYHSTNSELYAYISVGEVAKSSPYYRQIPTTWLIGQNRIWDSAVIDQANPAWRDFFIKTILKPLWEKGYRGFFLDTLDSYQLAAKSPVAQQRQTQGLIQLIHDIKKTYPSAKLIFNRGFELIPSVSNDVTAVAVESLFASWDQQKKRYVPVSQSDRDYLLLKLREIQALKIPVIVIDYLPASRNKAARALAEKIKQLGMIPWIATGDLESVGVGAISAIPRKIFVVYTKNKQSTFDDQSVYILLTLPLQYWGYIPEYHSTTDTLPKQLDPTEYAGVAVWAAPETSVERQKIQHWLLQPLAQHIPIVFLTGFSFDITPASMAPFGLEVTLSNKIENAVGISIIDKEIIGYEVKPHPNKYEFTALKAKDSTILLQIKGTSGLTEDAVAITPWGGYALYPYVTIDMPTGETAWVINPILFLKNALRLTSFPVPDVTTENGRRLLFAHVDGDGFATQPEFGEKAYAAEVLRDEILNVYRIPTTISVITSDIIPGGFNSDVSSDLMQIARDIFKLSWVEAASHTYSHPFDWVRVASYPKSGKYNLPIPNYRYNSAAEITGSIDFINDNLLPMSKTTKLMLWSGHANVTEEDLHLAYTANVGNLNGGQTNITYSFPSLANIGAYGHFVGPYYQIYAPISNEEPYTNMWSAPYWRYQRVIETFQLTDQPIRFKPIDIYYHFYSASKNASLVALKRIYDWALQQSAMPIFASQYVEKRIDAVNAVISQLDDGWQITTSGFVRELRAPKEFGFPDLERSKNVVGYREINNSIYIHLGPATTTSIYFTSKPAIKPYLYSANGTVTKFDYTANRLAIRLAGFAPIELELKNMNGCQLLQQQPNGEVKALVGKSTTNQTLLYQLADEDSNELRITCQ